MREIKFRAKTVDDSSWVYGYYIEDYRGAGYIQVGFNDAWYGIRKDTVGQQTGLYDRDGQKIYEDDIISFKTMEGEIVNDVISSRGDDFDTEFYPVPVLSRDVLDCKVIGNIHDNPELIWRYP